MWFESKRYEYVGQIRNDSREMAKFAVETLDYPELHPYFLHRAWRYGMSEQRLDELLGQVLQYYPV